RPALHPFPTRRSSDLFDCYFGTLPRRGQPGADGYTFDPAGRPANRNPYKGGYVTPVKATSECQASVTQNWNSTHKQIDGGRMDGDRKSTRLNSSHVSI